MDPVILGSATGDRFPIQNTKSFRIPSYLGNFEFLRYHANQDKNGDPS